MGQQLGPFLPLPTAPPILLLGPPLGKWGRKQSTPAADFQMAKASRKAWPALATDPEACGKRTGWEEKGQGLDRLRSKMVHCLFAGSLVSWETAMGASNSLDWRQKLLQKFLYSCHLLG